MLSQTKSMANDRWSNNNSKLYWKVLNGSAQHEIVEFCYCSLVLFTIFALEFLSLDYVNLVKVKLY